MLVLSWYAPIIAKRTFTNKTAGCGNYERDGLEFLCRKLFCSSETANQAKKGGARPTLKSRRRASIVVKAQRHAITAIALSFPIVRGCAGLRSQEDKLSQSVNMKVLCTLTGS